MLIPLSIVISISMLKDIFEDYRRHKSDKTENERQVLVHGEHDFTLIQRQNVQIGQVIKIKSG